MAATVLGTSKTRTPNPNARVLGGAGVAWEGTEGERQPDPVTPGVLWLGGARGGSRCEGLTHVPAGEPNWGELAVASANLAFRDLTLADLEVRHGHAARRGHAAQLHASRHLQSAMVGRAARSGQFRACAQRSILAQRDKTNEEAAAQAHTPARPVLVREDYAPRLRCPGMSEHLTPLLSLQPHVNASQEVSARRG